MPRMQILNAQERQAFDSPPVLNSVERKQFFELTPRVEKMVAKMRTPINAIGFVVRLGYFKATKRFFGLSMLDQDVQYVAAKLGYLPEVIDKEDYDKTTASRHRSMILDYQGYKEFDESSREELAREIRSMARSQLKPRFMFVQSLDILRRQKVELPNSWTLNELIADEIKLHKTSLSDVVDKWMEQDTRDFLDALLAVSDDSEGPLGKSKLALLKRISQSMKPAKIKATVDDFRVVRELYAKVESVLNRLDLTPEGIRYYAEYVVKFRVFQVVQRSDTDRYLHLACFAAHQCYRLQDTLVDILLKAVQNTTGACQREHKEIYYDGRNERRNSIRRFLNRVNNGAFNPLGEIESIAFDHELDDVAKVRQIQDVFDSAKDDRETATQEFVNLQSQLEPHAADAEYFQALESRSVKLQNRVSQIVKVAEFHSNDHELMDAINHYKEKDGTITQSAPDGFLDESERKVLLNEDGKFRVSLYKTMLFLKIADAVKAGSLNLTLSYKYQSLDDYMIPKLDWEENRDEYLERAELVQASDSLMTLDTLAATLHKQYEVTNRNVLSGDNELVRFHKDGRFHVTTPKTEDEHADRADSLFPSGHYISLLEILSTVNRMSNFVDAFEPWQTKYARAKPPNKTFYAGIMGLGCFIGTRKMEKISTSIDGCELETTVNSYFSRDNIQAANDQVLKLLDSLPLAEIYRNEPGVLHTSSDGQKHEVVVDSLNANYSYKYFGKDQGVTAYGFLDERQLDWYGTVFSSAEKEAHYVIDGLMHNDVVKSDIHSTDTDGYSEVVFGVTHLLGFSFAPRLKNLKTKTIYSFRQHTRKAYQEQEFRIIPAKYINVELIREHWDDILRFVATIKLKRATASQLFRRLNSYSNQHPLYAALKEFGRILKSDFILRYIDDLEFRQAIEKQLNKGENSNKFSNAVTVGNNQEFLHGEGIEQQIADGCRRLIKNSIVCWNYVYVSQLIAREGCPERRNELIETAKRTSMAAWKHVNINGEYDFSDDKMVDSYGLEATPEILELKLV